MSWLFEDPTTLVVAGALIEGLLAVALVKSGRGLLAVPMLVLALVLGVCLLVERLVVTDREQIEDVFGGVTKALMANDIDGVLAYIDPAAGMRSQVRNVLSGAHITDARIYDLEVEVNRDARPPAAQAELTGRVKGRYRGEGPAGGEGMMLRRFTVDFRLIDGRWLMTAYEDRGPLGGHRDD